MESPAESSIMMKKNSFSAAKKVAFCGLLAALAIVLTIFENMLPEIPLLPPGCRLGLSNIVTMFCAGTVGLPAALCIALLKSGFVFLTRGVTAGLMSLSGGLFSTLIMWLCLKYGRFGMIGVGICGALAHNAAQLLMAVWITSPAVFSYTPILILFSIPAGAVTGTVLRFALPALNRIARQ